MVLLDPLYLDRWYIKNECVVDGWFVSWVVAIVDHLKAPKGVVSEKVLLSCCFASAEEFV